MTAHTYASSTEPGLTWAGILAALDKLGPIPPHPDEIEINVSEWALEGSVLVADTDHARLRGWPRPPYARRWLVMIHPNDAKGRDLLELATAAVVGFQQKARESAGQWHPYPWGW